MSNGLTAYPRDPALTPVEAHREGSPMDQAKPRRLSERERQVLSHFAHGLSTKCVARILAISPRTIDTYAAVIVQKLRARNRIHAIAIALRMGIISPED